MLSLAALALAAASASSSSMLPPSSAWWEKITVTLSGDGAQQSCRYESSIPAPAAEQCNAGSTNMRPASARPGGAYTRITFERRFSPGELPEPASLDPGDALLGGQIMALAIDAAGKVRGCEILAVSGDMRPAYGCKEARAERFQASTDRRGSNGQVGYFTILVYGHSGQLA